MFSAPSPPSNLIENLLYFNETNLGDFCRSINRTSGIALPRILSMQQLTVNGTTSAFEEIGENPYVQGIQDFYF